MEKMTLFVRQVRKSVKLLPVKDKRLLSISFPIEDQNEHYKSKPVGYLGHLIGGFCVGYLRLIDKVFPRP